MCNEIKTVKILGNGKELKHDTYGGAPWFNIPGMTWIFLTPADCGEYMTVLKVELSEPVRIYQGEGIVISHN